MQYEIKTHYRSSIYELSVSPMFKILERDFQIREHYLSKPGQQFESGLD